MSLNTNAISINLNFFEFNSRSHFDSCFQFHTKIIIVSHHRKLILGSVILLLMRVHRYHMLARIYWRFRRQHQHICVCFSCSMFERTYSCFDSISWLSTQNGVLPLWCFSTAGSETLATSDALKSCYKDCLDAFGSWNTFGVSVGFGGVSGFLSGFENSPDRRSIDGVTRVDILNFWIRLRYIVNSNKW